MTNTVTNVVIAKPKATGGLLIAPSGTALPTDETTTLNTAFLPVGFVTDDGISRTEKIDSSQLFAWGGVTIALSQKSKTATLKATFAEYLNPVAQKAIYGAANVTTVAATVSAGNKLHIAGSASPVTPVNAWIIDMFGGAAKGRLVLPLAQIDDLDDVMYKDDELAARGVEVTLFPDAAGNYFYEYWDDGQLAAS